MPEMKTRPRNRHIRPVERQPMKAWLVEHLESGDLDGLTWVDEQNGVFKVKWCHGSRQGWTKKDMAVFEQWAKHTGRHYYGKEKDEKKWKANFRCALNSLKDVKPVDKSLKGQNAFREYRILGYSSQIDYDRVIPVRRRPTTRVPKYEDEPTQSGEDDMEQTIEVKEELKTSIQITVTNPANNTKLPNFEKISPGLGSKFEYGKPISMKNHHCGFVVTCNSEVAGQPEVKDFSMATQTQHQITTYQLPDTPEYTDSSPEAVHVYKDNCDNMEMVANSIIISESYGDSESYVDSESYGDSEEESQDSGVSTSGYPLTPPSDCSPCQDQPYELHQL